MEIKNRYIKDDGKGTSYMSGCSIPRDADGITRNVNFVDCDFHPASDSIFEGCSINGVSIPNGPGCLYEYVRGF